MPYKKKHPNFGKIEFILYVSNQKQSKSFYQDLLQINPSLDVDGMTEFELSPTCKLGLMPENGIAKILKGKLPHPSEGNGIPRCELYIYVDDVKRYYSRAKESNVTLIDDLQQRDWGDTVCYFSDPDGNIIAFAQETHFMIQIDYKNSLK